MSLFDAFRRKPEVITPPPIVSTTLRGKVNDNKELEVEAKTLDEFTASVGTRGRAEKFLELAVEAQSKQALDGTAEDFDQRPGHVVAPGQNYEYHPDSGNFQYSHDDYHVTGGKDSISVTYGAQAADRQGQSAVWNLADGTLAYEQRAYDYPPSEDDGYEPPPPNLNAPLGELHSEIRFQADGNGAYVPPQQSTLADAKALTNSEDYRAARRAEELIASATTWHAQAQSMDGTAADQNSDPMATVLPNVSFDSLPHNLKDSDAVFYADSAYSNVDLQSNSNSLFASSYQYNEPTAMAATFAENGNLDVTVRDFSSEKAEKVSWNKATGEVRYQQFGLER